MQIYVFLLVWSRSLSWTHPMTCSDCTSLRVGNPVSSGLAELGYTLHPGTRGSWTMEAMRTFAVCQRAGAPDIFGESLLGVFSKGTQTPSGPWEGEAKLLRSSVSMNYQEVCYADLLTSDCGVAGQGIQALSKRMEYTDQVPAGSDWHASERHA